MMLFPVVPYIPGHFAADTVVFIYLFIFFFSSSRQFYTPVPPNIGSNQDRDTNVYLALTGLSGVLQGRCSILVL